MFLTRETAVAADSLWRTNADVVSQPQVWPSLAGMGVGDLVAPTHFAPGVWLNFRCMQAPSCLSHSSFLSLPATLNLFHASLTLVFLLYKQQVILRSDTVQLLFLCKQYWRWSGIGTKEQLESS